MRMDNDTASPSFGQVDRPPTLTAAVADKIRSNILSGNLRPGMPLREEELSRAWEISRGTLRAALHLVQKRDGLVEIYDHRGAFVTGLSPRSAQEIYSLRSLLESYAVQIAVAAKAYTPEDITYLEKLCARLRELENEGDLGGTVSVDMEFHRFLSEQSGHLLLLDVLGRLQSQTLLFILHTKVTLPLTSSAPAHQDILAAVRAGDPDLAADMVRRHIAEPGAMLLKRITESASDNADAPQRMATVDETGELSPVGGARS